MLKSPLVAAIVIVLAYYAYLRYMRGVIDGPPWAPTAVMRGPRSAAA